jgi:hypothetical protein
MITGPRKLDGGRLRRTTKGYKRFSIFKKTGRTFRIRKSKLRGNIMAVSFLLYECEISTLVKNDERRRETAELNF